MLVEAISSTDKGDFIIISSIINSPEPKEIQLNMLRQRKAADSPTSEAENVKCLTFFFSRSIDYQNNCW